MSDIDYTKSGGTYDLPTFQQANWKVTFGEDTNFSLQLYVKKGPNLLQRWLYRKLLGLRWEKMNNV